MDVFHVVLSLVNIILILILIWFFYKSYREVRSRFSLGLMIFGMVLLLDAIFRCPLFYLIFTPSSQCPYSDFYRAAAGFEFIALLTLLYLVRE